MARQYHSITLMTMFKYYYIYIYIYIIKQHEFTHYIIVKMIVLHAMYDEGSEIQMGDLDRHHFLKPRYIFSLIWYSNFLHKIM